MVRYIDAEQAYKILTDYYHQRTEIQHIALKEALGRVPTANVQEIRHGVWEEITYATTYDIYGLNKAVGLRCSSCKQKKHDQIRTAYCPNCGARMGIL